MIIKSFINYLQNCQYQQKDTIVLFLTTIIFLPIVYVCLYYIFHVTVFWMTLGISFGLSRLLWAYILETNYQELGDPSILPPIRYLSYSVTIFAVIVFIFLTLKYANENNSVTDRIKETNKPAYKVSEKNETNASLGWGDNHSLFPTTTYPILPSQQQ
jgi:hypothetical protein